MKYELDKFLNKHTNDHRNLSKILKKLFGINPIPGTTNYEICHKELAAFITEYETKGRRIGVSQHMFILFFNAAWGGKVKIDKDQYAKAMAFFVYLFHVNGFSALIQELEKCLVQTAVFTKDLQNLVYKIDWPFFDIDCDVLAKKTIPVTPNNQVAVLLAILLLQLDLEEVHGALGDSTYILLQKMFADMEEDIPSFEEWDSRRILYRIIASFVNKTNTTNAIPPKRYTKDFPVRRIVQGNDNSIIGREKELIKIGDLLQSGKKVIVLWGMGGIGKSTIAMEFARKGRFDYLQTVLFSKCVSYNDLLNKIMYSKEIRDQITADSDSKEAIQREAIGQLGSNQLIIIDNANQANETLISNLLVNTKFRTIITTKKSIEIEHPLFAKIEIKELPLHEAYALFISNYKCEDANITIFTEVVYNEYYGNTQAILMVAKMLKVQGISLNEYRLRAEELRRLAKFEFSHNGETAYGTISTNLCFFLQVTDALKDLDSTSFDILKVIIRLSNVKLLESILIESLALTNSNYFIEFADRGLIERHLLGTGGYYIKMHPLVANTLTDYGISPDDVKTKEMAKKYVNLYNDPDNNRADLYTIKELLVRFKPLATTEKTKNMDDTYAIVKPDETVKVDLLDVLLDENNTAPIYMFDDKGNQLCFDQVAVIPYGEDDLYCILKPETHIDGVAEDEAIVFLVTEDDKGEAILKVCDNEDMAKAVFREYYRLILDTL